MTPIAAGQRWERKRKGEEHRLIRITGVPENTFDPRAYVRIRRLDYTDKPRAGEMLTRTLRKDYRLVEEKA